MIGIDTNVLVRYIAQDDRAQSAAATAFIEQQCTTESPGFVGLVVVVEVVWVCQSAYGATRTDIAEIVRRMLTSRQLLLQDADVVWKALRQFAAGRADFADCLIHQSADSAGCSKVVTFDRRSGMTLLR